MRTIVWWAALSPLPARVKPVRGVARLQHASSRRPSTSGDVLHEVIVTAGAVETFAPKQHRAHAKTSQARIRSRCTFMRRIPSRQTSKTDSRLRAETPTQRTRSSSPSPAATGNATRLMPSTAVTVWLSHSPVFLFIFSTAMPSRSNLSSASSSRVWSRLASTR